MAETVLMAAVIPEWRQGVSRAMKCMIDAAVRIGLPINAVWWTDHAILFGVFGFQLFYRYRATVSLRRCIDHG